jgi:DnaK suppressor protein
VPEYLLLAVELASSIRLSANTAFQSRLSIGSGESLLTGLAEWPHLRNAGVRLWTISCMNDPGHVRAKGMAMKIAHTEMGGFQEFLERKEAELVQVLRKRDGIAIEKSADQMDEIQFATERDLMIRNVDRESSLLRDVKDALRRIHDGSFGPCIECESAISPKRLAVVPWASRCIQCQDAADRDRQKGTETLNATLLNAA